MFGSLISVHYIGKKNWMISAEFWIAYLVIGLILGMIISIPILVTILTIAAFFFLAMKWLRMKAGPAALMFAFAFIIDIIIVYIMLVTFGISVFLWTL